MAMPSYAGNYDPNDDRSRVFFGSGCLECLPGEVSRLGTRAMLITGNTIRMKTNLVQKVSDLLGPNLVGIFAESALHTPRGSVLKAASMARELGPDVIITLGAGSHSDIAKALRLALWQGIEDDEGFDRAFRAYKNGWQDDGPPRRQLPLLPQIGIPTTLIAAESTQGVGVTSEKTHSKQVFSHPDLRSRAIILDPELSMATPPALWFSTGIKALEHAIAKLSALERHPVIDPIAEQAVSLLGKGLRWCWNDREDLGARNNLLIGSWLCMFGTWESLVKRMGLSHALGRQIGGVSGAAHGMISSVMLPLCMAFNASVSAAGLAMTARALGIDTAGMTAEQSSQAAVEGTRSLIAELQLPNRLCDIGVRKEDLPLIARQTINDMSTATNPRKVTSVDEVLDLLQLAWGDS